jgi:hypothetical protein
MEDLPEVEVWFDHLTHHDIALLERSALAAGAGVHGWRHDPAALGALLAHPATFAAVWTPQEDEPMLGASPFLVFGTAVHRAWIDLQGARHVDEWVGVRQRLPVLGGDDLRTFLEGSARRLFLASLLASYTSVASGSTWVRTPRGWRRTRFSELDPVGLAALLDVVPPAERAGVYRRLGDLALFLTGVFPDHTDQHVLGPLAEERLLRASRVRDPAEVEATAGGPVGLLERLGGRWYRLAVDAARLPRSGTLRVVAEVGEQFGVARRVLNVVTDRYLYPVRDRLFGGTGA